jgi:hypothetical protein
MLSHLCSAIRFGIELVSMAVRMKNRKTLSVLRNLLLLFWFGWFALAGIIVTGLTVWLTSFSMTISNILLVGSVGGIVVGGFSAGTLLFVLWRKFGAAFLNGYITLKMLRDALFNMNTRIQP